MRYQALKNNKIKLGPKAQLEFDAKAGVVLVPDANSKVFIHWVNDNDKLIATYTMTFATRIEGSVKFINALAEETNIQIIEI
jgi:hypothetical protein